MKKTLLILLVLLFLAACSKNPSQQGEKIPGEFIVKLKEGAPESVIGENTELKSSENLSQKGRLYLVKGHPQKDSETLESLSGRNEIVYVEPNYVYKAIQAPNDRRFENLWGLFNSETSGVDIGAKQAWELATGSRDVVVAVIDSGLDYEHEDLKDNSWVNEKEKNGEEGVDDDNNGYVDDIYGYDFINDDADPMDDNDHGTHCAGTIGATGNNNRGVVGVNWQVSMMGLKFLSRSGTGSLADAIRAIDYATENGAQVINASWGGGGASQALEEAIQRASDQGVLFVAAAGNRRRNNDTNDSFPANYKVANVISVASINQEGELSSFSNYGESSVHLAAPGSDIESTVPGNIYKELSGTSMAAPHVAGAAALLMAYNSNASMKEIKKALLENTQSLASLQKKTISGGLLDASAALRALDENDDDNNEDDDNTEEVPGWNLVQKIIETPHPYPLGQTLTYEFKEAGAEWVVVKFESLQVEKGYDSVNVYDGRGQLLESYTGSYQGFSPIVYGDSLTIELESDGIISDYGFKIRKAWYWK